MCYDYSSTQKGLRVFDSDNDIYAFNSIPNGYKATGIMLYGTGTNGFCVYNSNLSGEWGQYIIASGSGLNSAITFTPSNRITGSEDNFLVTKVDISATSDRIYGGYIAIEKV